MTLGIYEYFKNFYFDTSTQDFKFNLDTADIRAVLVNNKYVPDYYNDTYYKDIKKFEIKGKGYEKGGKIIGPCKVDKNSYNAWTDVRLVPLWKDLVWNVASFTAAGVVYYWNKNAVQKPLMVHQSFGLDMTVEAGTFTMNQSWHGLLVIHARNELMTQKYPAHPYRHVKPELLINSIQHIKPLRGREQSTANHTKI